MQPGGITSPLQPQEGQQRSSRGVTIQTTSTTHLQNPNTLHPLGVCLCVCFCYKKLQLLLFDPVYNMFKISVVHLNFKSPIGIYYKSKYYFNQIT